MADTCPKCGFTGLAGERCPRCGVIVALYEAALDKFRRGRGRVANPTTITPTLPVAAALPVTPSLPVAPPAERRPAPDGGGGAGAPRTFGLSFHGSGRTLFGIQIVNMLYTLVTLGVYSFWGKVRVRRYLSSQMEMAGDRFAYHGTGVELLRGFAKAVLVLFLPLVALSAGAQLSGDKTIVAIVKALTSVAVVAFVPVAMVGARRYRLSRTSWRGIRFGFRGRVREFMKIWATSSLLTPFTLGLYYPIFHCRSHAFMVSNSTFGQRAFGFDGRPRETLRPFVVGGLLTLLTVGVHFPWYVAWRRRYYWSHTTFGTARFRCTVTGGQLLGLFLGNLVLLVLTLGFAWPWARVRSARLVAATLALEGPLDLEAIVQGAPSGSATGDAVSSFLGSSFDFA